MQLSDAEAYARKQMDEICPAWTNDNGHVEMFASMLENRLMAAFVAGALFVVAEQRRALESTKSAVGGKARTI
ncbi:MAG: hypothetical protein ABSC47_09005 [Terracidiphilus sp.]|jgi:hypothetical protein